VEFDPLGIYGKFYCQKCNVNVTVLNLQFEQIKLSKGVILT